MYTDKDRIANKKWTQNHLEQVMTYNKEWSKVHRDQRRASSKKWLQNIRLDVITHYGGKCTKCGDKRIEVLQLDHINDNGNEHRKSMGKGGSKLIYLWAKQNDYPNTLQLLCANCHQIKSYYEGEK